MRKLFGAKRRFDSGACTVGSLGHIAEGGRSKRRQRQQAGALVTRAHLSVDEATSLKTIDAFRDRGAIERNHLSKGSLVYLGLEVNEGKRRKLDGREILGFRFLEENAGSDLMAPADQKAGRGPDVANFNQGKILPHSIDEYQVVS
ncbi:hypothetical protein QTL95_01905 [Rhizobium sp. S152]|nr:hypothetical protein [Rhizobium sp. S152]MDM9624631.1 hypothetical protein [Rhizobium sp. S152]